MTTIVTDTSALLEFGTTAVLSRFGVAPHSLAVPFEVVEELESHRVRETHSAKTARAWLRVLDASGAADSPLSHRVRILDKLGNPNFNNTDSAVTRHVQKLIYRGEDAALLTVDVPMRVKARHLGVPIADYEPPKKAEPERYLGILSLTVDTEQYATCALARTEETSVGTLHLIADENAPNTATTLEAIISLSHVTVLLVDSAGALLNRVIVTGERVRPVNGQYREGCQGLKPQGWEQRVAFGYLFDDDLPVVSLSGPAGTGKTLLAVGAGVSQVGSGLYDRVMVLKSLYEMGDGQDMGYLPGTVEDKMAPYAAAVDDALGYLGTWNTSSVEVQPITYLRGRSLHNTFIIIDEAQNLSRYELLNVLSRVGHGSKVVLTFDDAQVDNPKLQRGPGADVWRVVRRLATEDIFAHITLSTVQRSEVARLAGKILEETR